MVGEFHSHTKDRSSATLSNGDIDYYLRESQEGREILGKDWVELVVRINEIETEGANPGSIYGNYQYKKAERLHIKSSEKTYDLTLSAWFIKQKNDEINPIQGTLWIEWPII